MTYFAPTAAAAAFLGIVCMEGFAVFFWRFVREGTWHAPMYEDGPARSATRRALFLWLGAALFFEASHNAMRTGYFLMQMETWPHALSFWLTLFEASAVLGLIRTFTRRTCGEWGWIAVAILPLAAAIGVLFR